MHQPPSFDIDRAEAAVADLLRALGVDPDSESLSDTPRRVASMYAELLSPRPFQVTTFPNDGLYDELVIVRDIPFHSLCEHHLLPFMGKAHVAYLPRGRIVGLSKIARVVDIFARRPQLQERLTCQIADLLMAKLDAKGTCVIMEAVHTCMTIRGAKKPGSTMVTSAVRGTFKTNHATRSEAINLLMGGRQL